MIKRYYEVSSSHPVCYHPPFLLCMNTSCFFDFVRFNINIKAAKQFFIGLNSRYTKVLIVNPVQPNQDVVFGKKNPESRD